MEQHSSVESSALFSPAQVAGIDLRNPFVMSPMTRRQAAGGTLHTSDYYLKRARGGVGLIITEGVAIDHPVSDYTKDCPQIAEPAHLSAWRKVVDDVHAAGTPMVLQLWHTGIRRPVEGSFNPHLPSVSPTGDYPGDWPHRFEPMTEAEIEQVIDAFARAAEEAKALGFDGVEIHAAHGYLVDQFFWDQTNSRTDKWGGDATSRTRFGCEVVREIKRRTGADYPVFLRFSQWKLDYYEARLAETPQELEAYLLPLAEAGVDVFDASTRRFWVPEFKDSDLNLAGWAKKITGKASMTVGSVGLEGPLESTVRLTKGEEPVAGITGLRELYDMFERGDFDLVGVGRALLANPDWVEKVRDDRLSELAPYTNATAAIAVR